MKMKFTVLVMLSIFGLSSIFAQVNIDSGLVAKWYFNGNANDESGNGNNGTVYGATLTTDRFGNANKAYSFDGVSNYIDCGNDTSLAIHGDISVCAWVKSNSTNLSVIIAKYGNGNGTDAGDAGWELNMNNNSIMFDGRDHSGTYISSGITNILGNNWHFMVGQRKNDTWKIYYDGILANSFSSGTNGDIYSPLPLEFGRELNTQMVNGNGLWYNGLLDDIRIYSRSLNEQEIQALYQENICYQTITVTDTLIIYANLTNYNPITFLNTIKVYPNPTNDHITINYGNYQNLTGYTIKITNSLGQTMFTTPINQQSNYVDLNNWTGNGIYFVYLIDAQSNIIEVRKIVIQ